jgi:outer membrane protein insertion porin family
VTGFHAPGFSLLLAAVLTLHPPLYTAPLPLVRAITVSGHVHFSSREILGHFGLPAGSPYSAEALTRGLRAVEDVYRAEGFLTASAVAADVRFDSDSSAVDIGLAIVPGRRSLVRAVTFSGATGLPASEAGALMDTKTGEPLRAEVLERDVDAVLRRYESLGHPFTQCSLAVVSLRAGEAHDSIDLVLGVTEGPLIRISEVRVEGTEETDPAVVIRESRIRTGDLYLPETMEAVRRRLNRLAIFEEVAEPELFLRDGGGGLLLRVREGPTSTFDGVVGYLPPPPDGEATVTGLVSVSMRNLFGTGRKFSARWQRDDRFSRELAVRYLEPWIAGAPINVEGGFRQRQQDSLYVRNTIDLRLELMLSEELSGGVSVAWDRLIPSGDSLAQQGLRTSATAIGAFLRYDSRDDRISPKSGVHYESEILVGRRQRSSGPGANELSGTVQRYSVGLELFLPVSGSQVVAVGGHGRQVRTDSPEEGELERFGGTRTLRGYRENEFAGTAVVWGNLEYRFLTGGRSYIYGFVDAGFYSRPADERSGRETTNALKSGYGIGLLTGTPLGYLGVGFALGRGDGISNGKIHVGLINDF